MLGLGLGLGLGLEGCRLVNITGYNGPVSRIGTA